MKTSPKPKSLTTNENFTSKVKRDHKKENRESQHVFNDTWEHYFIGQMVFEFYHKVRSLPFNYFKKLKEAIKKVIRKIKAIVNPNQLSLTF